MIGFSIREDRVLKFWDKMFVPNYEELRIKILKEGHNTQLTMHPGSTKMYQNLQKH